MEKAFGYLRVSGKGQVKGDGFPRQLQAIKAYASAHNIRIVRVFREEGVTGTKESMDRPMWSEVRILRDPDHPFSSEADQ